MEKEARLAKQKQRNERLEKERLEKERLEKERVEERKRLEVSRLARQKLRQERLEKDKLEREKLEADRIERERIKKEMLEKTRIKREISERLILKNEGTTKALQKVQEGGRLLQEQYEKRLEEQRLEEQRLEEQRLEEQRLEKERLENERLEKERRENERLENEKLETGRLETERIQNEQKMAAKEEHAECELIKEEKCEMKKIAEEAAAATATAITTATGSAERIRMPAEGYPCPIPAAMDQPETEKHVQDMTPPQAIGQTTSTDLEMRTVGDTTANDNPMSDSQSRDSGNTSHIGTRESGIRTEGSIQTTPKQVVSEQKSTGTTLSTSVSYQTSPILGMISNPFKACREIFQNFTTPSSPTTTPVPDIAVQRRQNGEESYITLTNDDFRSSVVAARPSAQSLLGEEQLVSGPSNDAELPLPSSRELSSFREPPQSEENEDVRPSLESDDSQPRKIIPSALTEPIPMLEIPEIGFDHAEKLNIHRASEYQPLSLLYKQEGSLEQCGIGRKVDVPVPVPSSQGFDMSHIVTCSVEQVPPVGIVRTDTSGSNGIDRTIPGGWSRDFDDPVHERKLGRIHANDDISTGKLSAPKSHSLHSKRASSVEPLRPAIPLRKTRSYLSMADHE
jgi:hypothetical protein